MDVRAKQRLCYQRRPLNFSGLGGGFAPRHLNRYAANGRELCRRIERNNRVGGIFMHCPQCGQQQDFDKIRFCRQCGFALSDVKELLVPEAQELKAEKKSKIGSGVAQGLALILFGFVLISILAILRDLSIVPQVFVKIAALIFCVGGLVRMCYPFLFNEGLMTGSSTASLEYDAATHTLIDTKAQENSLSSAQSFPIASFKEQRSFVTAELPQPPSVTEHTTKLLKDPTEQK